MAHGIFRFLIDDHDSRIVPDDSARQSTARQGRRLDFHPHGPRNGKSDGLGRRRGRGLKREPYPVGHEFDAVESDGRPVDRNRCDALPEPDAKQRRATAVERPRHSRGKRQLHHDARHAARKCRAVNGASTTTRDERRETTSIPSLVSRLSSLVLPRTNNVRSTAACTANCSPARHSARSGSAACTARGRWPRHSRSG